MTAEELLMSATEDSEFEEKRAEALGAFIQQFFPQEIHRYAMQVVWENIPKGYSFGYTTVGQMRDIIEEDVEPYFTNSGHENIKFRKLRPYSKGDADCPVIVEVDAPFMCSVAQAAGQHVSMQLADRESLQDLNKAMMLAGQRLAAYLAAPEPDGSLLTPVMAVFNKVKNQLDDCLRVQMVSQEDLNNMLMSPVLARACLDSYLEANEHKAYEAWICLYNATNCDTVVYNNVNTYAFKLGIEETLNVMKERNFYIQFGSGAGAKYASAESALKKLSDFCKTLRVGNMNSGVFLHICSQQAKQGK